MGTLDHVPAVFRSGSFTSSGRHDLLLREADSGDLYLRPHLGRFDGPDTYGPAELIATGFGDHLWLCAGDLTGNGRADVVVITDDDRALIHLNIGGSGTDTLGPAIHVGGKPPEQAYDTIALGDLTGSGRVDIIGRVQNVPEVHRILNQGAVNATDTFGPPLPFADIEPGDLPVGLVDVTLTGLPDLLIRKPDGTLWCYEIYAGGRDDTGSPLQPGDLFPLGDGWNTAVAIDLSDVDNDGNVDLLALHPDGVLTAHRHLGVFDRNRPDATYGPGESLGTGWDRFDIVS